MDIKAGIIHDVYFKHGIVPGDLADHLFLPKRLPDEETGTIASVEVALLELMTEIIAPILDQQGLFTSKCTFKNWTEVQSHGGNLNQILARLSPTESVCYYVRKQNCTILFTKLDDQNMRIITFRSSLPNKTVTSTCGSLLVTYPETVDVVPISPLLLSPCFSQQLESLVVIPCEIATPTPSQPNQRKKEDEGKSQTKTREPSYPYLISEFVVGLLCPLNPSDFGNVADREKIEFQKKLRDQVNWKSSLLPFRRSGLWMSIKVILQLSLRDEMENNDEAKILYKIIILQMLNILTSHYINWAEACEDVTAQIIAKLARRTKKLLEMTQTDNDDLETLKQETTTMCWSTIDRVHYELSAHWNSLVYPNEDDSAQKVTEIRSTTHDWITACIHLMSSFTTHINSPRISNRGHFEATENLKMIDSVEPTATVTLHSLLERQLHGLSEHHQDVHMNDQSVWIYQTEWFVRHRLNPTHSCDQISNLMSFYLRTVFHLYATVYADPIYYSRMTITFLKFVAVLDEIAVEKHPLLSEYKTGITPEMFHSLIIPDKTEMEMVEMLQNYFQDRNSNASYDFWLGKNKVEEESFFVKFAEQNEEMGELKVKILDQMELDIEAKKSEILQVETECSELQEKINRASCTYKRTPHNEKKEHDPSCYLCALRAKLKIVRKSVTRYQRPLPPTEYLRDAVVFELIIPPEISFLRDGVIMLLEEIIGYKCCLLLKVDPKQIQTQWTTFRGLEDIRKTGYQSVCHLGSTAKDFLTASSRTENPDVLLAPESAFIIENGLSCQYYRTKPTVITPLYPFTFKIEKTAQKDAAPYKNLQFALDIYRSTENEVLSKQCECQQNLSLKEFRAFGALRCAHRLQFRNLYAELAGNTLSLDKEPVLELIMQTVWELGPGKKEIHYDFEMEDQKQFAMAFLDLLKTLGEENGTCWSNPIVLLTLSVIVTRILEINESFEVKYLAGKILQRYRVIADQWCKKLEELLVKTGNQKDVNELKSYLLKAALCSVFTFNVIAVDCLSFVVSTAADVTHFLNALFRLHCLVIRENILTLPQNSPSLFICNLVRHARLSIPLNLQQYLHEIIPKVTHNVGLHHFAASKWQDAEYVASASETPTFVHSGYRNLAKKHAYQAIYPIASMHYRVCVDILRGTFFVDGCPPSLLPEKFIRDPLFQSYFQSSQFRVQRVLGTYKTTDEYRGNHFEFTEGDNDTLVIRQLSEIGGWYELIPRKILEDVLAHDLVNNYTHWFCSLTSVLHFRRPATSDTEENIENDTDYKLMSAKPGVRGYHPNMWHLCKYDGTEETSRCILVSIESDGFNKIVDNLKKLESSKFIHVQNKDASISARLWRHNLSFSLGEDGLLYCDNYPGFYIPASRSNGQNLETLVGLQNGIILERKTTAEPSGKKKLFLIQHGTLSIMTGGDDSGNHQGVVVSEVLRNPTYFVFEVDQTLKRLCPGKSKSAWLYLAALHAATSSPWPDPFTQLTGVEMAMWILQSAYVWSCSPYNKECTETLLQISAISPLYKYYPEQKKDMQAVTWPKGLEKNSYAAYDGYAIIVEKLLKDSKRLEGLFPEKSPNIPKTNAMELCRRSYYRNINSYNKTAQLTSIFMAASVSISDRFLELSSYKPRHLDPKDLITFAKYRQDGTVSPVKEWVDSLIMITAPLSYSTEDELTKEYVPTWLNTKFRNNWLQLYTISLKKKDEKSEHALTFMLGAMLYSGQGSMEQVLNLHNVSVSRVNGVTFPTPPTSLTNECYKPLESEFVSDAIKSAVQLDAKKAPARVSFGTLPEYRQSLASYKLTLSQQVAKMNEAIKSLWPRSEISEAFYRRAVTNQNLLNDTPNCRAHRKINEHFKEWKNNWNLKSFIEKVDAMLRSMGHREINAVGRSVGILFYQLIPDTANKWERNENYFDNTVDSGAVPYRIISTGQLDFPLCSATQFSLQREQCIKVIDRFSSRIRKLVLGDCLTNRALSKAGLHDRVAPLALLREKFGDDPEESMTEGHCHVRALAVAWAHLRRLNRLIMYDYEKEKYSVEMARELETRECEGWNPLKNPEWLLLELELDITIRPIQVQVATQMMEMPNGKSGTMQLNMGEGKTSVIIPMIVATLSSRRDLLCRVNVLNSIYATNFNLLGATIGGLLDKRLYTVPCSRDLNISEYLKHIQLSYKDCIKLGGVLMTLPEHRLSFRLQMYNNFLQKGKEGVGYQVHHIESRLREHVRDLVDESDEIFGVKYQLIYTSGKQLQIDGGSLRWTVCQKLLEFLPVVATHLFDKFGTTVIEFNPKKAALHPEKFLHFRILSEDAKHDLNELMVDGILNGKINIIGRMLREEEKKIVKEFLISETISEANHNRFMRYMGFSEEKKQALLLVSGYLRRGILYTALKKRWRVEYGVKKAAPDTFSKLMAVPFRAKDVAAERTEFGHPDVAILLTQLSYFYSGLSDDQLYQCFKLLETDITAPETVYNSWIRSLPPARIESDTVKTYQGINLQDYEQRTKYLFPILRKHRSVVNFYLENAVFPKESKQFPGKLVTNAWDLCYERYKHPTTGFSGTNDTSLLLPAPITQQDLPILVETNVQMEEILMREGNEWKRSLEMGVTCKEVLNFMIEDNLQVLIDAGALMLQLGNEEIAQLWLDLDKSLQGVVYFDEAGDMVIKIRRFSGYRQRENTDKDAPLALSPFRDNLENCAVYLDDQHTRGTDVKLPTNFKACVTVGSGMRRDKLIQSCMRMRKLGQGQRVNFYLSHEVHNKIVQGYGKRKITVNDIIAWTKSNSNKFEKDGLVYWATNARTYAKNLAADDLYELSEKTLEDGIRLGERCEDPDAQALRRMYGTYHRQTLVTSAVPDWFTVFQSQFFNEEDGTLFGDIPEEVQEMLENIKGTVLKKCEENIPEACIFHNMLDEEQEKELEPEHEVELQKYRPPKEFPLSPCLHPNVEHCVINSDTVSVIPGISRLCDIFRNTTIKKMLQECGWGEECYASDDFINVIKKSSHSKRGNNLNSFLKDMRFMVSFKKGARTKVLLLSKYEVNSLITVLRVRCSEGTTLHMFSGRWMEGQPTFVNNARLQLPIPRSLTGDILAPLFIAAGNLHFDDMREQQAFARFLGLRLRPWTEEEETAFNNKTILNSGFVLPSCPQLRQGCKFVQDPVEMVMAILKVRNDVLRETDHVVNILDTCTYLPPVKQECHL